MTDGDGGLDGRILDLLFETVREKIDADPETSYTARLAAKGRKKVAQKVGEEGVEAALEIAVGDAERLASESADLFYHLAVAWAVTGVTPTDVWHALERRQGVSGLAEKAARPAGDGPDDVECR